jgi:tetratricopeptide (TPR) repeat protein
MVIPLVTTVTEPGLLSRLFFFDHMKQYIDDENIIYHRKSRLIPHLIIIVCSVLIISVISFFVYRFINYRMHSETSISTLYRKWNNGKHPDYEGVYDTSRHILLIKPFNNTALTYHGYSCFYLAVSQLDTSLAQNYLDEAINSLRLALLSAHKSLLPQLEYMLGKAYFYKNTISSYYYADLAVKYLTKAKADGYKADDIPEYLGLSYASLDMTMDSIASFTEALLVRESDSLLLSIAEQYNKAGQNTAATQYLYRIISSSSNDDIVIKSRILLGNIYISEEKYNDADQEFTTILKKNENSADAYYGLGVIYEKQGDLVKARSEWRKALRIQVNHPGALKKLADYK